MCISTLETVIVVLILLWLLKGGDEPPSNTSPIGYNNG